MPPAQVVFPHSEGCAFLSRVTAISGSLVLQNTLSTITCAVYDMDAGSTALTAILSPTIVISSVIYDTIQGASYTDTRWKIDATGYNFLHSMPATAFPKSNRRYRVEYKFTPVSGEVFYLKYEGRTDKTFTSATQ